VDSVAARRCEPLDGPELGGASSATTWCWWRAGPEPSSAPSTVPPYEAEVELLDRAETPIRPLQ